MCIFIQNRRTEPNHKTRFGSGLDHINYTSGSYITRTEKMEPNREPLNFYNIVYIFIYTNNINFEIIK